MPHVPDTVPGERVPGAGARTEGRGQPSNIRGGSRMQESCTYGSVRGAPSTGRPYRNRAMQARLNAKIAGSSCAVRNSRGRNCSFGGRRGVGIGSPITRNRGLSTVRKIVVGADVVIGLSSLIFLVSQFNTVRILRGNRTV